MLPARLRLRVGYAPSLAAGTLSATVANFTQTHADVARVPLLVFCQRDYPEYWDMVVGWLRDHGQRPRIAVGYRAERSDDRPLAVFVEELRKAAAGVV